MPALNDVAWQVMSLMYVGALPEAGMKQKLAVSGIAFAGEQNESEGCLSNPGQYGITKRPKAVTVRATDRHGNEYELSGTDLLARAICHECDHLDGKLYTDVQISPDTPAERKRK